MHIYISGIFGTAMKPLALMAKDAGFEVVGSDLDSEVLNDSDFKKANISVSDKQDGVFLAEEQAKHKIDWYLHSSAVNESNEELRLAKRLGLKITKRDEFIAFLIKKLNLKMIAIAGTHGKTTTTAMLIWTLKQLGVSFSYLVGSSLPFAKAGHYAPDSDYFIYEADEYDRNFLSFSPWISIVPAVSYDHADIYKSKEEYLSAFKQFVDQSQFIITGNNLKIYTIFNDKTRFLPALEAEISLTGKLRRYDARLAGGGALAILEDITGLYGEQKDEIVDTINNFPGVGRRFERIDKGIYSDYAHHPEEIKATIEMALEEKVRIGLNKVAVIYEPHQNSRQHVFIKDYGKVFQGVDKIFWLPTFLTREDKDLNIIKPEDFIKEIIGIKAVSTEMDENLVKKIREMQKDGFLVLLMTAGPADRKFRKLLKNIA